MVELREYADRDNLKDSITITISDESIRYDSPINRIEYKLNQSDSKEEVLRKLCLEQGTPLPKMKLKQTTKWFNYPMRNKEVHISITTKKLIKYSKTVRVQIMSDKGLEPIFEYKQASLKPVSFLIKERLAWLVNINIDDSVEWDK